MAIGAASFMLLLAAGCSLLVDSGGLADGTSPDADAAIDVADVADVVETDADVPDAPSEDAECGATFCDSFERAAKDVKGPWTSASIQGGGELLIDATIAASGTSSLRVHLPVSTTDDVRAFLVEPLTGSASRARLAFAMRVETIRKRQLHLGGFGFQDSAAQTAAFLLFSPNGELRLGMQDLTNRTYVETIIAGFQPGVWQRYELEIVADPTSRATVRIDGALAADVAFPFSLSLRDVGIGPSYSRAGEELDLLYDDVAVVITR